MLRQYVARSQVMSVQYLEKSGRSMGSPPEHGPLPAAHGARLVHDGLDFTQAEFFPVPLARWAECAASSGGS